MTKKIQHIPLHFDIEFLDWFRRRTESTWAALPQQTTYQDVLAKYAQEGIGGCTWQYGTHWLNGLNESEIMEIENRWNLVFPPDYRLFLERLHSVDRTQLCASYLRASEGSKINSPTKTLATMYVKEHKQYMELKESPSFMNWLTDDDTVKERLDWLWEGISFDAKHTGLWPSSWGHKPAEYESMKAEVRSIMQGAPQLIPLFGHRYLLAEPCESGNPVFSVWQSDIVVFSASLRDLLLLDFADILGLNEKEIQEIEHQAQVKIIEQSSLYKTIRIWGELLRN